MICTPTELRAERERLGLSRNEMAELTSDSPAFIRQIEHTKSINIPAHVVKELERLAAIRSRMQHLFQPTKTPIVIITYHSDDDLDQSGTAWDKMAPTASFHRALCSHVASVLRSRHSLLLIAFNYPLFAASRYGSEDTSENRRAWAIAQAKRYRIIKEEAA